MRAKRIYTDYVRDILDAAAKAMGFVEGMDYEAFQKDDRTNFAVREPHGPEQRRGAVVRALTIIGEAVKKIPRSVRERYPEVPWRDIAGTRDKVTHEYFGVDLQRVFGTVKEDLPTLRAAVVRILSELGECSG